jgi:hypothetical protein
MTRNLETRDFITSNFFGNEFFIAHAGNICRLRYSDFYDETGNMVPAQLVTTNTGVALTVMMIQTLRGVCSVARIKYSKKTWTNVRVWIFKHLFHAVGRAAKGLDY